MSEVNLEELTELKLKTLDLINQSYIDETLFFQYIRDGFQTAMDAFQHLQIKEIKFMSANPQGLAGVFLDMIIFLPLGGIVAHIFRNTLLKSFFTRSGVIKFNNAINIYSPAYKSWTTKGYKVKYDFNKKLTKDLHDLWGQQLKEDKGKLYGYLDAITHTTVKSYTSKIAKRKLQGKINNTADGPTILSSLQTSILRWCTDNIKMSEFVYQSFRDSIFFEENIKNIESLYNSIRWYTDKEKDYSKLICPKEEEENDFLLNNGANAELIIEVTKSYFILLIFVYCLGKDIVSETVLDIEDFSGEKYSAVQDYERLSGRKWIEKNYSTSLSDNQLHFIARNCLRYECHPESKIPLVYTIPKNKYSKKTLLSELHIDFKLISSCNNEFDIIDKIVKLK